MFSKNCLNAIKNSTLRGNHTVSLKLSKKNLMSAQFLCQSGLIRGFERVQNKLLLFLKYDSNGNSALNAI
jgi:ribosomal protein S8